MSAVTEQTENVKPAKKHPPLYQPVELKPAEGKSVRKEDRTWLPAEGDTVIYTPYWARRYDEDDVELVTQMAEGETLPAKRTGKST
jgi:hypothetical protein